MAFAAPRSSRTNDDVAKEAEAVLTVWGDPRMTLRKVEASRICIGGLMLTEEQDKRARAEVKRIEEFGTANAHRIFCDQFLREHSVVGEGYVRKNPYLT